MEEIDDMMLFSEFPSNYTYLQTSSNADHMHFRIKEVIDKDAAKVWLQEYSKKSKTTWRIMRTYPDKGKYNIFKVDYKCCHNTDKRAQGTGSSKHTGCEAKLEMRIQRFLKNSKGMYNDVNIQTHPCEVKLYKKHNHQLDAAASLMYRDLAPEIKEKFIDMFRSGHNPSSSLKCHITDLMQEMGTNYYKAAADKMFMPSYSQVSKLFKKEFLCTYGDISGNMMFENLKSLLETYMHSSCGKAEFKFTCNEKHYFVVLCTPIMLRAHEKIVQAGEIVLIDAAGGIDKQQHRIYFIVTPCVAGGIPLGIIITDSEETDVFTEALECLKNMLPSSAFFYKQYPRVIITDNDLKEIYALQRVYPYSLLLLCQFHMLKSMWTWLCDSKHGISKDHRQELYFLFRQLQYSDDETNAKNKLAALISFARKHNYLNLIYHISNLMKIKEKWISAFRQNLPIRGSNITNYVEVAIKILKDCILDHVMAFNLIQLVNFILKRYDAYMRQRLVDFCKGVQSNTMYRHRILLKKKHRNYNLKSLLIKNAKDGIYEVCKMDNPNEIHFVDIERRFCSCTDGNMGQLCRHSLFVVEHLERNVNSAFNSLHDKTKENIFYVAEGRFPEKNWFLKIHKNTDASSTSQGNISPTPSSNIDESATTDSLTAYNVENDCENSGSSNNNKVINEIENLFVNMLNRIKEGVSNNPSVFVPAAQKMLKNAKQFANTDTGLLSAMHTFGSYAGIKQSVTHVAGKKDINAGRPHSAVKKSSVLLFQDYTTFGQLPSRKRKASHDLKKCVLDNKSLGNTKVPKI